jgi:hypothetical protein
MQAKTGLCLLLLSFLWVPLARGQATPAAVKDGSAGALIGPAPEIFSPGVISGPANDGSPTFAPDGNTVYFTRSTAAWGVILESHKSQGSRRSRRSPGSGPIHRPGWRRTVRFWYSFRCGR